MVVSYRSLVSHSLSLSLLQLIFETYGTHGTQEVGPLRGLKVNTPYQSKDHLQQKRYVAQNLNTSYIYDFVELFRQVPHSHSIVNGY